MSKLHIQPVQHKHSPRYQMWCPGCDMLHEVDASWTFNGDLEHPTFSPSIKVTWSRGDVGHKVKNICHSFLRDGVWQFLGDCTHDKAGQHVAMVDLPDWVLD